MSRNTSDIDDTFLPQELAEIITTQQRRECALYARTMIYTTANSYLNSSVASFTNGIEKVEVVAFKAYLQQAIANFAAVDSYLLPLRLQLTRIQIKEMLKKMTKI